MIGVLRTSGRIGSLVSPCLQFVQVPCCVLRAAGQELVLSWGLWSAGAFGPGLGVGIPDFVGPLVWFDLTWFDFVCFEGGRGGVGLCTSSPGVGGFCCMGCSLLFRHGIVLVHVLVGPHFCFAWLGSLGVLTFCAACGLLPGSAWWGYSVPVLLTPSYRLNKTGQVGCIGSGIRIPQRFSVLRPNVTLNWPKQSTPVKRNSDL